MDRYTIRGSYSASFIFTSLFRMDQPLRERACSPRSKAVSVRIEPILEWFYCLFIKTVESIHHDVAFVNTNNYNIRSITMVCLSYNPGSGCSKLTTSLVNVLEFQMLLSDICQYFLLKKCEKLLQCKTFSYFFQQKNHCTRL